MARPHRTVSPRRGLCYALIFLFILSIGRLQEMLPVMMKFRPALITMALALVSVALRPEVLRDAQGLRTPAARRVAMLALFACIGAPFGISLGNSGLFLLQSYAPVLMFFLLLVIAANSVADLSLIVSGYLLASALLCIHSIFFLGMIQEAGSLVARLDDSGGGMFDPNDICVALSVAIPLAVLKFQTSRWLGKLLSATLLIACVWTIALSGSRGGFIGLLIIGAQLLFTTRTVSLTKRIAILVVLIGALSVAAPAGYWRQMNTILAPEQDYNWSAATGRRQIAIRGLHYMAEFPVFGLGIANFNMAECSELSERDRAPSDEANICAAPHNSFIQSGAELGVPGLLLWSSLIIGGILGAMRVRRRLPKEWDRGSFEQQYVYKMAALLPLSFAGFAVTAFFVTHAWTDMIYSLSAFSSGLYVAARQQLAADAPLAYASDARSGRVHRGGWTPEPSPPPPRQIVGVR